MSTSSSYEQSHPMDYSIVVKAFGVQVPLNSLNHVLFTPVVLLRSPNHVRSLEHAISDIRDVPHSALFMHKPIDVILDEIRSAKCLLPTSKSRKENSVNLGFANNNNISNDYSNQLVTNTDDPIPLRNQIP